MSLVDFLTDRLLNCVRCGYSWKQRGQHKPKECPSCKSRYWC